MSREIVFRGKTASQFSQWIEGDLIQISGQKFIRVHEPDKLIFPLGTELKLIEAMKYKLKYSDGMFLVDPATIGQFTGLYDANKKRIFEGDVMSWKNKTFKVTEGRACYFAISESNTHWFHYLFDFHGQSEVIGNIHDNPELMEVKNG